MSSIFDLLGYSAIIFCTVNAYLYFKSFTIHGKAFKYFTWYLISVAAIQISSVFVGKILHAHNLFLSHFYFVIQFVLLSFFYFELLKYKWIKWLLILILILVGVQYIITPEIFFKYNSIGLSITHSILVLYSLLLFYKGLDRKQDFIIVNVGIFFYLLSSTLIFASGNLVFNLNISKELTDLLVDINGLLYLVFQILIFIEWWRNYKKPVVN